MDAKDTSYQTKPQYRIAEDVEFYKYIFKKTEKIVCAVFYILNADIQEGQKDTIVRDAEESAKTLLDVVLLALRSPRSYADVHAREIQHALLILESKLRILHASRILREGYLEVFLNEIDTVHRSLRKYIEAPDRNPFTFEEVKVERKEEKRKVLPQERRSEVTISREVPTLSRRERILGIIKDKGEASIKDISTTITDCSEKTIQRELIDMIKDNLILRDGERRWSKYKLV